MSCTTGRESVGCLFIDDIARGAGSHEAHRWASDIPGVEARVFQWADAHCLWERLQTALYEVRGPAGGSVMAVGTGCAAALALACQLPVEKLVLINPASRARRSPLHSRNRDDPESAPVDRTLRKLTAFAHRNLPLCVSDMLIVQRECEADGFDLRRAYGNPVNCCVRRLVVRGESAKGLYTIREFEVKEAISRFLHPTDAPKPLAENSEMCIIYG